MEFANIYRLELENWSIENRYHSASGDSEMGVLHWSVCLSDPFVLPNGTKLNALFYADDLIILSRSKLGLENCLNKLSSYCNSWMLKINPKKTKIMVFQKGTKKMWLCFSHRQWNDRHCKRLYLLRDSHLVFRKFYTLTWTSSTNSPGPRVIPWAFHEHFSFFEEV